MKPNTLAKLALATALTMSSASAATIAVDQYEQLGRGLNATTANFNFNTITANNSVLFVAIGSEGIGVTNVSFNGVTLTTPTVSRDDVGLRESYIFAFDLGNEVATASQQISVTTTDHLGHANGFAVSALQISNADFSSIGFGVSDGGDITVPLLASGSLVLDVIASNTGGTELTPSGLPRTTLLAEDTPASARSRSSLIANTTGNGSIGWTGQDSDASSSAIWIAAIPEPSAFALLGLGGLGLLLRRRR